MNTPDRHPHQTDPARRRLLRGSFSAPAVLALTSGSALAATSSTCFAQATASPSTADIINNPTLDTLMRVRLRRITGDNDRFVARSDLGDLTVALSLWDSGTLWQRFGINPGNQNRYNKFYGAQESGAPPASTQVDRYVALRFDSSGNIVGMGLSGVGSVVASSCWTSVKAL